MFGNIEELKLASIALKKGMVKLLCFVMDQEDSDYLESEVGERKAFKVVSRTFS